MRLARPRQAQTTRSKRPKRKNFVHLFNLKLTIKMYKDLYAVAKKNNVDMSVILRDLIGKHLSKWRY